jgi:hypothetical protein
MKHQITAAAVLAALVAATITAGAFALEGAYQVPGQDEVFTFGDGHISGTTADGIVVHDAFAVDGDTVTITAPSEHPICPDAVGTYTFAETDTDVTFTLVEDSCEARAAGMTAGPWVKAE